MKHFIVTLLVGFWLLGPHAFADVNAKNGISITTASTINGKTPNSAFNGLTIASGGAWYYTTPVASIDSVDSNLNANTMSWFDITLPAGSATQIGVYISTVTVPGATVRLGLWNSGGTELVDVLTAAISTTGFADVTFTSVATSATTYKIGYIGQSNDEVDVGFDTAAGTNAGNYNASQSGGNFPSSLPTADGQFNGKSVLRVWVQ